MTAFHTFLEKLRFIVEADDVGARLDQFLTKEDLGMTRSRLKKLIDSGHATIDGETAEPSDKLRLHQEIFLTIPEPDPVRIVPEEMTLDIRYEDDFLIVVNKPRGLVVHPAPGHASGTLINGILFGRTTSGGDPMRPGIVHRLDKDTSGLMVVAKDENTHDSLARQFHDHTVDRSYRALVTGIPPTEGEWKTLHGRASWDRKMFTTKVPRGKIAHSRFKTLERFDGAALLAVVLMTGRTHQVRVHCHDHGFAILGDTLYSPKHLSLKLRQLHQRLEGQALHAAVLGFDHPVLREHLYFESEPPPEFLCALAELRNGA